MLPHRSARRRGLVVVHLALLALLALLVGLGAACAKKESPEVQIRKVLDEGAAALEARDAPRAAETLSDTYKDGKGRTKDKLQALAFFALQQGPVLVSMQTVDIKVAGGDKASMSMKVLAIQGSSELKTAKDLLPTNARSFDLTIAMVKEGSDWKVASIDGIPGGGGGFD